MTQTDLCLKIAATAHAGQIDRSGDPVILHPLTVGLKGKNEAEICAGFLHDVAEDTDFSFDDMLAAGVREEIVAALQLLTHDKSLPYLDYVRGIIASGNPLAIAVKLNDLRHNLRRGTDKGYPELVKKHSSAWNEFVKAGFVTADELKELTR